MFIAHISLKLARLICISLQECIGLMTHKKTYKLRIYTLLYEYSQLKYLI